MQATTCGHSSHLVRSHLKGRRYYSIRTGKNRSGSRLNLSSVRYLFGKLYSNLDEKGYFQEAFGLDCEDSGYLSGRAGRDLDAYFFRKLRKHGLWPVEQRHREYDESDLFDVLEFLYDHVSEPETSMCHGWDNRCRHYGSFNRKTGQSTYRSEVNELLSDYDEGYLLSRDGEIVHRALPGTETLLDSKSPTYDVRNVDNIIVEATECYKRSRSSETDKRNAVKMLADVLEFLRPKIKAVLSTPDENDLFNIANNFGIRHHNKLQKTDYDQEIWLDWMFYYYLAAINAVIRLIKNREPSSGGDG